MSIAYVTKDIANRSQHFTPFVTLVKKSDKMSNVQSQRWLISDSPIATKSRIAWQQIEMHFFSKVDSGLDELVTVRFIPINEKSSAGTSGPFVPCMVTIHHDADVKLVTERWRHIGRDSLGHIIIKFGPVKFMEVIPIDFGVGRVKYKSSIVLRSKILSKVSHDVD